MTKSLDPVTLEIIRNTLPAIANEMAADLQRTSYNMMIYEVCDFCTALQDPQGRLLAQNVGGVSHFVADLGVIIQDGVKHYDADGFRDGDAAVPQGPDVHLVMDNPPCRPPSVRGPWRRPPTRRRRSRPGSRAARIDTSTSRRPRQAGSTRSNAGSRN